LPVFETDKQSAEFKKIAVEEALNLYNDDRADNGAYNEIGYKFGYDYYSCKEHGLQERIDDREKSIYSRYFDLERVTTARLRRAVMANAEKRVADAVFNASTFTGVLTGAASGYWTNWATASPVTDIDVARRAMRVNCGLIPNALIVPYLRWLDLIQNAEIISKINASGAGSPAKASEVTPIMVAQCLNIDKILIPGALYNSAIDGQDASIADLWNVTYSMLARVATGDDLRDACLGRTFHYNADGSNAIGTVESYYSDEKRGDIIRVRRDTDEKMLYASCGYLITGVAA
jgi:hypothetical protein